MGAHSWGAEGWGVQDIFLDKECQTRKISPENRGEVSRTVLAWVCAGGITYYVMLISFSKDIR